ncbi:MULTISPECIES: hypothetical protein [unclassified Haladaptatus]|uniref:hypothetical protein n=1 Tax=unclassified Haladaptatus TaxID=2622732 RepID=UPI0023E76F40|nr:MULTISPECIES: hypothetical protein [unclassified Haladaptatus]
MRVSRWGSAVSVWEPRIRLRAVLAVGFVYVLVASTVVLLMLPVESELDVLVLALLVFGWVTIIIVGAFFIAGEALSLGSDSG